MFPARILTIEDGAVLAENLKTFLGRRATDIRIALDAETAMEILHSFAPDMGMLG
jgi:PleD family two-component response regulator